MIQRINLTSPSSSLTRYTANLFVRGSGLDPTGRMLRHIPINDASRAHVQHHEDVEQAESHGDGYEEITGQDRPGVMRTNVVQR
jgi:hypothetical protein